MGNTIENTRLKYKDLIWLCESCLKITRRTIRFYHEDTLLKDQVNLKNDVKDYCFCDTCGKITNGTIKETFYHEKPRKNYYTKKLQK